MRRRVLLRPSDGSTSSPRDMSDRDRLRDLPSVDRLATAVARAELQARREELLTATAPTTRPVDLVARARARLRPRLRRVLNATGVVVHTNLGRARSPPRRRPRSRGIAAGYSNLELDLSSGERGSRHDHVEELLRELTGAEAAIAVNNCAAAVLLAVRRARGRSRHDRLAGAAHRDRRRLPDPRDPRGRGTRLVEVGTTNRTRRADYEPALAAGGEQVGAILRAHPSNFRTVGFVEEVEIEALCDLGVPVIDDVGSGVLTRRRRAARRRAAGAPLGPRRRRAHDVLRRQAARRPAGGAARRHARGGRGVPPPSARARGADRQAVARRARGDPRPASRPGGRAPRAAGARDARSRRRDAARARATSSRPRPAARSSRRRRASAAARCRCSSCRGRRSRSTPARPARPRSPRALRAGDPAVVGRMHDGRLLLDPRTLTDDEAREVARAVRAVLPRA